ncbi:MAG: hypothetical protein LUH15_03850 [Tannerellaceae bacterium]|nr:hypothetical protein [Tannerellaceae bacterium]
MKDPRTLYRYFLYASLVLIGIVIGVAVRHYYHMPIEETINIVDLATLVVTVFLAVYIPEVLNRKSEVQKDKKRFDRKTYRGITIPVSKSKFIDTGRRAHQSKRLFSGSEHIGCGAA